MTSTGWLFVTAGVGRQNHFEAAQRLVRQIEKFELFDSCIILTNDLLLQIEPNYLRRFTEEELANSPGYGYYAWKPILAVHALEGGWGKVKGVFYLDAGSEALATPITKRRLEHLLTKAEKNGAVTYPSGSLELSYSKSLLIREFADLRIDDKTVQIQSGSWMLYGEIGRSIARTWLDLSERKDLIDDTYSSNENQLFIGSRHDQSILSLICKRFQIEPENQIPRFRDGYLKRIIFSNMYPFRSVRNRGGASDLNPFVAKLSEWMMHVAKLI